MNKLWQSAQIEDQKVEAGRYAAELHPMALSMLARRGLLTAEQIEDFLNPSWEKGVHDPFLFNNMAVATDRILRAVENQEHIVIHGDYDADGVTGSAVLAATLKMLLENKNLQTGDQKQEIVYTQAVSGVDPEAGARFFNVVKDAGRCLVDVYIPHREKEGYGLNQESVDLIHQHGCDLLMTVDCGIANVKEIEKAVALGMDVIVVDHHQHGEVLPPAMLIHPKVDGENYPFKDLAAVGVAWKLATGLTKEAEKRGYQVPAGWDKWLLDLVSIATITDIVPLIGENRVLEKYGLLVLNKQRRPGIRALVESANWRKGELDSETVGFVLGPRINAAGRMEHAHIALDLLMEEDLDKARLKASELDMINRSRQKATENLMQNADKIMEEHASHSLIFAWSPDWSPSLVGLAAGKYADKWGKPAVFVGNYGGVWIGSGRSVQNYDITAAVREAGEGLLLRHGGHAQACGFSLDDQAKVIRFGELLRQHAAAHLVLEELQPVLQYEARLELKDINDDLLSTLKRFEPFGEKNPKPVFMSGGLEVVDVSLVGAAQNHIRCLLKSSDGRTQKFIGFYRADLKEVIYRGMMVDVVYEVGESEWNGKKEIQCKLVDARAATLN